MKSKLICRHLMNGVIVMMLFTSCATSLIYQPNTLNMPLPERPYTAKVECAASTQAIEGKMSYAVNNHLVTLANYSQGFWFKNNNLNVGAGYYKQIAKGRTIEVIGGYGYGASAINKTSSSIDYARAPVHYIVNTHHSSIFLQGDIGGSVGKLNYGCGLRLNEMIINGNYHMQHDFTFVNGKKTDTTIAVFNRDFRDTNILFVEPGLNISYGGRVLRVKLNIGASIPCTADKTTPIGGQLYQNLFATAGIEVKLITAIENQKW